jgi:hypothetical protein
MSKRVFKLRCDFIGRLHAKFTVLDPDYANCGTILIRTADLTDFIYYSWNGRVDWNEIDRHRYDRIFPPENQTGSGESLLEPAS